MSSSIRSSSAFRNTAMPTVNTAKNIVLLGMVGLCMASWRKCSRTDLPCIQFEKRLCICTPFWDPKNMKRIHLYVCETAPFNMPKWVTETWACPIPGVGGPQGTVWSTYLDPLLKGLIKLSDLKKVDSSPREQASNNL